MKTSVPVTHAINTFFLAKKGVEIRKKKREREIDLKNLNPPHLFA